MQPFQNMRTGKNIAAKRVSRNALLFTFVALPFFILFLKRIVYIFAGITQQICKVVLAFNYGKFCLKKEQNRQRLGGSANPLPLVM